MPSQDDPRNGIAYGWTVGESGWATEMNDNLRYLGSVLNVSVISILSVPPGSPSNGDSYIVGATPTGAWAGQENAIAIWFNDDTQWRFFAPTTGLTAFLQSDTTLRAFNGSSWSTNGFSFTF